MQSDLIMHITSPLNREKQFRPLIEGPKLYVIVSAHVAMIWWTY